MENHPGVKFSAALLIAVLVSVALAIPVNGQTGETSMPFGSSLKKPEAGGQATTPVNAKSVDDGPPRPEEIVKVNTSLVNLDVSVTDAKGSRYITGLTRDDFVVAEDDQPQTVETLTIGDDAARLPRSIVLIFDRSNSQFPYLEASIEAAKALVNQLASADELAVVTDDVELAVGFTKDKKKLRQTLDSLKKLSLKGYRTRSLQFSALLATLRELTGGDRKRPIIIFQTDGDEVLRLGPLCRACPRVDYDMNTIYSEVEKSRTKIYTVIPNVRLIGVPQEEVAGRLSLMAESGRLAHSKHKDMWYGAERHPPKTVNDSAQLTENLRGNLIDMMSDNLLKGQIAAALVADLTGGWTSFLEKHEQATEIYGRILADINHRYIISYYPTNKTLDGKLRKVRIEVKGHPEYLVQGRTSYFAITR